MGLDLGLEKSGHFVSRVAVEIEPAFCNTLRINRDAGRTEDPKMAILEGDIRKMDPVNVLDAAGLDVDDVDLLVGGPPCQTFSTTGRRGTVRDMRGTLLWEFLRFIEAIRPRFFLMENVRGLMSAALQHRPIRERPENGGPPLTPSELPGSVVRAFVNDLNGEYRMDIFEVNAVNYGAPQLRERVLFVGNNSNQVIDFPQPTHGRGHSATLGDNPSLFDSPASTNDTQLLPFRTLGDALAELTDNDPVVLDFSPRKKHYLSMVLPGSNWRSLPSEIAIESMGRAYYAKGGRSGWWRRLNMDLPSPTIVTMPNHASTALCHPTETRALTLRECARIQEFPDDWEFVGSPSAQFTQVGNAVPIRLGVVAGDSIAPHLINPHVASHRPDVPSIRRVYLKSHVRTREWYRNGVTIVHNSSSAAVPLARLD